MPESTSTASPNHTILFPTVDTDDEQPLPPARTTAQPHWYSSLIRPAAYVGSGLAGALLVTAIYGLLGSGSRSQADGAIAGSASVTAAPANDLSALDRRADTLALAIEAFTLRARMFDSRRMGCPSLARGLQQVEAAWIDYNIARKGTFTASDDSREARDRSLYADVRGVELHFERSSCVRP